MFVTGYENFLVFFFLVLCILRSWLSNPTAEGTKARAYQRLFTLFGMPKKVDTKEARDAIGKYGLGTKRTLEQYQQFIGVNLTTLEVCAANITISDLSVFVCLSVFMSVCACSRRCFGV